MDIIHAKMEDIARIMEIVAQAQAYFRSYGIAQWQDGYPSEETIVSDIRKKEAYVIREDGIIIGFAVVTFGTEPAYENEFTGTWLSESKDMPGGSYAVVHRIAIAENYKQMGFATELMNFTDELCRDKEIGSIKIDTHPDNLAMRRMLKKSGFMQCGTVNIGGDASFIAYEKLIKTKVASK